MKQHHTGSTIAAFIAGATAALVAGGYFLYGPDGKRHRKQTEGFVGKMQDTIEARMERAKDASQETYNRVVDEVVAEAGLVKALGRAKANKLAQKFKDRWEDMKDEMEDAAGEAERELAMEDE